MQSLLAGSPRLRKEERAARVFPHTGTDSSTGLRPSDREYVLLLRLCLGFSFYLIFLSPALGDGDTQQKQTQGIGFCRAGEGGSAR